MASPPPVTARCARCNFSLENLTGAETSCPDYGESEFVVINGRIFFEVGNTRTQIHKADPFILNVLSEEARYPTETADLIARSGGYVAPDSGWNGWVRLLHQPKTIPPWFPSGLLPKMSRICRKYGYESFVTDNRKRPGDGFPEFTSDGSDVVDRDYQLEAVRLAVEKGRGVLDIPPRGGKTRILCEITRQLGLPTIWIAPTDRIVTQTQKVLEEFFGANYAVHLVGSKKMDSAMHARVVVCTAATAANLPQEFYDTREVIVIDEFHHASAKSYKLILDKCEHIYFRYGMTGTFFRSNGDEMAMHALLSDTIYKVESQFLLDRQHLVPTKVLFLPMPRNPMVRGVGNVFITGHGKFGIHEHKMRNHLVAWAAVTLQKLGRKVLVLVGTKKQGYALKRYMSAFYPEKGAGQQFEAVEFISTDKPRPIQGKVLESYLDDQEVKILIGTSLLGEGVDLPTVDALVYARGEKAEVTLKQNAYRVCTAMPGKTSAIIVDFADRHHGKLLKHSHSRLEVYHKEATFDVSVLENPNYFAEWARSNV